MPDFQTIAVTRNGQLATVTIQSKDRKALTGPHIEIGAALAELRYDNSVRVVVITGTPGGFFLPPKGSPKASGQIFRCCRATRSSYPSGRGRR